jgi:hypothetical protein
MIFLVDGMLYNVHRYFFQRDSSNFASMFCTIPYGGCGKGLTDDEPLVLPRVAANDFDLFLSILYPSDFGVHAATTITEWTAILDLAASWNFKSIKALAIKQLACIASPIDKIVLGRKHNIEEWLGDAYEAVCVRDEPLTLEEGNRLGMEDVIKISATRQRIHQRPLPLQSAPFNSIRHIFGLEPIDVQEVIPHVLNEKESIGAPAVALPGFQLPATALGIADIKCAGVGDAKVKVKPTPTPNPLTEAQKKKLVKMLKRHKQEREALPYWNHATSANVLSGTLC